MYCDVLEAEHMMRARTARAIHSNVVAMHTIVVATRRTRLKLLSLMLAFTFAVH
jgi:hypothetical protein